MTHTTDSTTIAWLLDHAMLEAVRPIAARYSGQGSQWRYPYAEAGPRAASATASVWFTAYPGAIITRDGQSVLATLGDPALWRTFAEIGIQAIHTGPMKQAGGLNGTDFTVDPDKQQTITYEHVSGWSFGDVFAFVDVIKFNGEAENGAGDGHTFYGEISPRLSLGKISGADLSFGPIKDVLLATTYGKRDGDSVWQITPVWSYTIPVGNSDLVIDGFMDWVVDNDESYHANLHFNPQIKYDVAKAFGVGQKFYVGVEYDYWSDKYGIEDESFLGEDILGGTDQSAISLLVKAHF